MNRAPAAAMTFVLLFGAACESLDATNDDIQVGFAAGTVLADGRTQGRPDIELDPDLGAAAFVEAVIRGDTSVHFRLVGSETETTVRDSSAQAEIRQVLFCPMIGTDLALADGLVLRPLAGFGAGYASITFGQPGFVDEHGAAAVLTAGFELEVAKIGMLGAMGWGGVLGEPGDHEGETTGLMLFAGFRL